MNLQDLSPRAKEVLDNSKAWCVNCLRKICEKIHERYNWCLNGKFTPKYKTDEAYRERSRKYQEQKRLWAKTKYLERNNLHKTNSPWLLAKGRV